MFWFGKVAKLEDELRHSLTELKQKIYALDLEQQPHSQSGNEYLNQASQCSSSSGQIRIQREAYKPPAIRFNLEQNSESSPIVTEFHELELDHDA